MSVAANTGTERLPARAESTRAPKHAEQGAWSGGSAAKSAELTTRGSRSLCGASVEKTPSPSRATHNRLPPGSSCKSVAGAAGSPESSRQLDARRRSVQVDIGCKYSGGCGDVNRSTLAVRRDSCGGDIRQIRGHVVPKTAGVQSPQHMQRRTPLRTAIAGLLESQARSGNPVDPPKTLAPERHRRSTCSA